MKPKKPVKFASRETRDAVEILTEKVLVRVEKKTGAVRFITPKGKLLLSERAKEPRQLEVGHGYVYFDWNCANGDAAGANTVEKQLANCKSYPKSASNIIVLMHDSKSTTLEALPKIIEYYKSCGMSFGVLTTATPPVHHGINN